MKKLPVIFVGHGDPMIALRDDSLTRKFTSIGNDLIANYGKPKAILCISAHWYTDGSFTQNEDHPRQIYDMYGFPDKLYKVQYPAQGSKELSERVSVLLGSDVSFNNSWGIDHGTWTVLVHMFPKGDIPVVQLSVNRSLSEDDVYEIGKRLAPLRDEGFLIIGSGNIVHNLSMVDWHSSSGSEMAYAFNDFIVDAVVNGNHFKAINYLDAPYGKYAVPINDHYLPLIYCLGASGDSKVYVFNNVCNLGAISMTGFIFS